MSFEEIVDNTRTDKNIVHSYLRLYEQPLNSKKETVKNIWEIGIQYEGSLKLWSYYFINANIYGLDIMHIVDQIADDIKMKKNLYYILLLMHMMNIYLKTLF